jgi:hypothetical protein
MSAQSNSGTGTVSGYSTTQTVDTSVVPEPYTLSSSGTIDNTELAGEIDFSTPVTARQIQWKT